MLDPAQTRLADPELINCVYRNKNTCHWSRTRREFIIDVLVCNWAELETLIKQQMRSEKSAERLEEYGYLVKSQS